MPLVRFPLENESREKKGKKEEEEREKEEEDEDEGKGCFFVYLRDFYVSFLRLFVKGVTTGKGVHFHNRAHAIRRFNLRRILARMRRERRECEPKGRERGG